MQNEEIKRALEQCSNECQECDGCPYELLGSGNLCFNILKRDALDSYNAYLAKLAELTPPVEIGATVKCACEELDEYGNPVTVLVPYEVCGVMRMGGKWYVLDGAGERYEVGTRFCITE